jgi:hypothetical protein
MNSSDITAQMLKSEIKAGTEYALREKTDFRCLLSAGSSTPTL